ncbi:MAG: hypothetical protein GY714_27905 [Desulfobacterales bacterium]|nr:hypothetical protein [Desulfobacterales bacterium]MCP4159326.1 hypothetical protein [Deltaproteobacteria bacterium]
MIELIKTICRKIKSYWEIADNVARHRAVDSIEDEIEEMEYIFALLVQGSFVGMPSPPVHISLSLLPHMEKDLSLMMERVTTSNQPISKLFSTFDIG